MNVEAHIKTEKPIPLKSRTIIHLSLVQNKINESIHAALKPFDISLQQFNVLRILRGQKPTSYVTTRRPGGQRSSNGNYAD